MNVDSNKKIIQKKGVTDSFSMCIRKAYTFCNAIFQLFHAIAESQLMNIESHRVENYFSYHSYLFTNLPKQWITDCLNRNFNMKFEKKNHLYNIKQQTLFK